MNTRDHRGRLTIEPRLSIDLPSEPLAVLLATIIDVAGAPALALAVQLGRNPAFGAVLVPLGLVPEIFDSGSAVASCCHRKLPRFESCVALHYTVV